MFEKKFRDAHPVFYVFYIIANILTLGTFWLTVNSIAYGVAKAMDLKESKV